MKQKVCVLGDGAWGTAIALLLADNGHTVSFWCYNNDVCDAIRATRCNARYLPGIQLSERIKPTTDIAEALTDTRWVFEAIPVKFLRSVLEQAKPYMTGDHKWVVLSKGIETDTLLLPSALIDTVLGCTATHAVLSGPSFAHDLALKKLTAVTLAANNSTAAELTQLLSTTYFKPYISADMIGTQIGGALKNIVALALGMLEGAGYADNTKAFILTRGLQEMASLTEALGGKRDTLYGLAGVGDLVLTCTSSLSKNYALGKQLGTGRTIEQCKTQLGTLPEGINTAVAVHQLAQKLGLRLPLLQGVYRVIFEQSSLDVLLKELIL